MPSQVAYGKQNSTPGLPVINWEDLWTLTYIKSGAVRTTILLLPHKIEVTSAVEMAKTYCKHSGLSFSWLAKSIVDLRRNQNEPND